MWGFWNSARDPTFASQVVLINFFAANCFLIHFFFHIFVYFFTSKFFLDFSKFVMHHHFLYCNLTFNSLSFISCFVFFTFFFTAKDAAPEQKKKEIKKKTVTYCSYKGVRRRGWRESSISRGCSPKITILCLFFFLFPLYPSSLALFPIYLWILFFYLLTYLFIHLPVTVYLSSSCTSFTHTLSLPLPLSFRVEVICYGQEIIIGGGTERNKVVYCV